MAITRPSVMPQLPVDVLAAKGPASTAHNMTDKFFNEGKGVGISYGILIDPAIVLYWSLLAIFLFNKEEG